MNDDLPELPKVELKVEFEDIVAKPRTLKGDFRIDLLPNGEIQLWSPLHLENWLEENPEKWHEVSVFELNVMSEASHLKLETRERAWTELLSKELTQNE